MAKRFTDSEKWRDPWFRQLSPAAKLLWQWILDNCDHAGVLEPDWGLAGFQIGQEVEEASILEELGERIFPLDNGKIWVWKFIQFQYGEISEDCRAHNPVFKSIEKHDLERVSDRVSIPFGKGKERVHRTDGGRVKDKDKDKVQDIARPTLEQARDAAPQIGVRPDDAEDWWHRREATDWMKGTAGGGTTPVGRNWQSDLKAFAGTMAAANAREEAKLNRHGDNSNKVERANPGPPKKKRSPEEISAHLQKLIAEKTANK